MEHEKLSTTFAFFVIREGCWMSHWVAGRSQAIVEILAVFVYAALTGVGTCMGGRQAKVH